MSDDAGIDFDRLYGVLEANALVPMLERVFEEVGIAREEMAALFDALAPLGVEPGRLVPPTVANDPAVRPRLERLLELNTELQERLGELEEMGIEVKGLDGLVDVRSRYDERIVYLCWRLGEPGFTHWHELDGGFAGRRPIADLEDFEGTLLV